MTVETDPRRYERTAAILGIVARRGRSRVCFLTGIYSHLAQHPPSWFTFPASQRALPVHPGPARRHRHRRRSPCCWPSSGSSTRTCSAGRRAPRPLMCSRALSLVPLVGRRRCSSCGRVPNVTSGTRCRSSSPRVTAGWHGSHRGDDRARRSQAVRWPAGRARRRECRCLPPGPSPADELTHRDRRAGREPTTVSRAQVGLASPCGSPPSRSARPSGRSSSLALLAPRRPEHRPAGLPRQRHRRATRRPARPSRGLSPGGHRRGRHRVV